MIDQSTLTKLRERVEAARAADHIRSPVTFDEALSLIDQAWRAVELEAALQPMVDNAMGYDKSLVRSAALCARGHGFSEENVQRLLKLEEDARAALAPPADRPGEKGEGR